MGPDSTGVEEMADLPRQRLNQMLGAREREADHVDYDVSLECSNRWAEATVGVHGGAVHDLVLDAVPGPMERIGLSLLGWPNPTRNDTHPSNWDVL